MITRTMKTSVLLSWMAILLGASVAAFVPPEVSAGTPCGSIAAVDRKTGIVTAKNTETGETFKIRVGEVAQIGKIKTGDRVSADFQTGQVTVHSFQPVEGILLRVPTPRPPIG